MSENRHTIIVPLLCILLVIIFMIPITGMLIDPGDPDPLNTPIYELDNQSLNDIFANQESRTLRSNLLSDIMGVDTTIVKNSTGWVIITNIDGIYRFNIDLSSELGYKQADVSEVANISGIINGDTYIPTAVLSMTNNSYTIATRDNNYLYFATPKTIEFDSVIKFENYLLTNDVTIYYEKDTNTISLTYDNLITLGDFILNDTYNYFVYESVFDLDLTESQWDYYHELYLYYNSL